MEALKQRTPEMGLISPELKKQVTEFWRGLTRPSEETEPMPRSVVADDDSYNFGTFLGRIPRKLVIEPGKEAIESFKAAADNLWLFDPSATKEQQELGATLATNAVANLIGGGQGGANVLNIGRPSAKKAIYGSLAEYWGKGNKEALRELKQRFQPYREALDVIPQRDLDPIDILRTEKSFEELKLLHPESKLNELYGLHIRYPAGEKGGEIYLGSNLPKDFSPLHVLTHEIAHDLTLSPKALEVASKPIKISSAIMESVFDTKKGQLTYSTNPKEIYANAKAARQEAILRDKDLIGKRNVDEAMLERISDEAGVYADRKMLERLIMDKPGIAKEVGEALRTYRREPEVDLLYKKMGNQFRRHYGKAWLPET